MAQHSIIAGISLSFLTSYQDLIDAVGAFIWLTETGNERLQMAIDYPNAVCRLVNCLEHTSERIQVSSQLLNLCMLDNVSCFLSSGDFFSKSFFILRKVISGTLSEYPTVWIQFRADSR